MPGLLEAKTYKLFLAQGGGGEQGRYDKAEQLGCQVFLFSWFIYLSANCTVNSLDMLL